MTTIKATHTFSKTLTSNPRQLALLILALSPLASAFTSHRLSTSTTASTKLWYKDDKSEVECGAPFVRTKGEISGSVDETIQHREHCNTDAWLNGFKNVEQESCYNIEGDFPADLKGTFFQNGPAKFQVNPDEKVIHPFDADGMIQAVTFNNGKAHFRNRYVKTPGYTEELKIGKICKRGVFGTARNKGAWFRNMFDLDFKNTANTNVLFRDNKLFALWEGGLPFEMDPVTLETVGESTMDQTLHDKGTLAAHYKTDPFTGCICSFGVRPDMNDPANMHVLDVMEHWACGDLVYKKTYSGMHGVCLTHDIGITENYFVFLQTPSKLDLLAMLFGLKGPAQCVEFLRDVPSKLILIPRGADKGEPIAIDIPPVLSCHTANAFEDKDGSIVVDCIATENTSETFETMKCETSGYPTKPIWETLVTTENDFPRCHLKRLRVNPSTAEHISMDTLSDGCGVVEFPVVNPNRVSFPYQFCYCGTNASKDKVGLLQGLAKIDVQAGKLVEKWLPEPHQFLSEVTFYPTGEAEDDGYLIGYLMDGLHETSQVVVFDARNPSHGPIAHAGLEYMINHSLHGVFVPDFAPPLTDELKPSLEGQ